MNVLKMSEPRWFGGHPVSIQRVEYLIVDDRRITCPRFGPIVAQLLRKPSTLMVVMGSLNHLNDSVL